jgi:hypothetical protein
MTNAQERFDEALDSLHATYQEVIALQKELIADAEKEIEQQRVTIQGLQDKLAGATL